MAALAGVTQAELEALYVIKPIAAPQRAAPPKVKRSTPSSLRTLLRCLVMRPELARQLPHDSHTEGVEGAAIAALVDWLSESVDETSTAAMIQHFQDTAHEAVFASAQGEVMQWGESFDVESEFAGSLEKLREESRRAELDTLHAKMQGRDLKVLNEQERARYLQLLQRG